MNGTQNTDLAPTLIPGAGLTLPEGASLRAPALPVIDLEGLDCPVRWNAFAAAVSRAHLAAAAVEAETVAL